MAVKELTDRLGDDIEFDLITARLKNNLPKEEKVGKVNVYRIGLGVELIDKLLVPFLGAIKAIQLNRSRNYSYFWCIMASFASGAAYIANWFQKRVPIILTLQEGDSENYLKFKWAGLIDLSWKLALGRADHLTAISNYLLERAYRLGFKGRATLVPNGVDIERFENYEARSNKDEVLLVTTSRLVTKNAVGDVIEAVKFLPKNFRFKILGTGPLEKSLKNKAKEFGVEERVEFAGHVDPKDIPHHLHQADIFVRPSLSEGMGNSFIEAMAAGLPVIGTPVGGIPDFLKDGETGLFVEPRNPRQIAFQTQKLVSDRVLRDKITINAKRMVKEHYDWSLIADEMRSKVFGV